MKKILGLDLGTNSIGWAVVNEAEKAGEQSSIVKLGVRVNLLTVDELSNFEKGKSITTNADRTSKRSARRNLQRYKLRRKHLVEILLENKFVTDETILSENGNKTTFETYRLRAKAATEEISLQEFARVLLMINKKRGYKSSRKAKSTDEGQLIDGMDIAKKLYEESLTPGQLSLDLLKRGKKHLPDFYRSDLQAEFDKIWSVQKQFYVFLTDDLKDALKGKNEKATWAICQKPFNIVGIKRKTKGLEEKIENYQWRVNALLGQIGVEELAVVLQKLNGQINSASGYLGDISDRSKELYFNKMTVGQYQMAQLDKNPNYSLKNQVFYRQDYLNEFEVIWETQAKFHKELTPELKRLIRDGGISPVSKIHRCGIFFQRPLKSQKGLISFCEFENKQIEVEVEGKKKIKTIGCRVCPKSSPLFQEFKIWQILNNVLVTDLKEKEMRPLFQEEKELLFEELNYKEKLSKAEVLKILFDKPKDFDLNYKSLDGNTTQADLFKLYQDIIIRSGHNIDDFSKDSSKEILKKVREIFNALGINTAILEFDSTLEGEELEKQPMYQLWHLLYSFEGDKSNLGNEKLIEKLQHSYGFDKEYAIMLAGVVFKQDYGSLSTKAIRKILPHLKDGNVYSVACEYAGYKHSKKSLTREELDAKKLKDKLELLPRNSLRNPVVEKILNQMVNVVNGIIDTYGKPDEIRIELARELKKSAKEREELTDVINKTTKLHEDYVKKLQEEFGLSHVSRNDIIRYKLYLELETNGFKTLYSDTYIPKEELFSKRFDIEHIIPQAKLFDDSFSNKTLEARSVNLKKGNMTAYDFVESEYGDVSLNDYKQRIEKMKSKISKTKYDKLLMPEDKIPSGFINRDLRDTQYIAKKAREMLEDIVKFVVPTTGSVTDRLREDWQLIDIMQELNWDKYDALGLTEIIEKEDYEGHKYKIRRINDWTKRNDHRHHAMDALTIAFTKRSFIQYLNNLNSRIQKSIEEKVYLDRVELSDLNKKERAFVMYAIEQKELYRNSKGKLRFNPPMPLDEFRAEAKLALENVLISQKTKNKVVTKNINKAKNKSVTAITIQDGEQKIIKGQMTKTPRGQLHLETVYGSLKCYITKEEKVNASFDVKKIQMVANKGYREALLVRLCEFGGDAKKAFTGKNSLEKNPIWMNEQHSDKVPEKVKIVGFETIYTIRKAVDPDLNVAKVVDVKIKKILEDRLKEFKNDPKKAFVNLDENPIWLNKEKGIAIKRVTIKGVNNAIPLHSKRDKNGNLILDENGNKQPVDFVNTGNNHHVAIFKKPQLDKNGSPVLDGKGNKKYDLDEVVVSFYEATSRANKGLPIIDKEYNKSEGWEFLFTMKQNEYFVFPRYDATGNMIFNPLDYNEEWFKNPDNYALISPNLFRVQTMSKCMYRKNIIRDYMFRHHLESIVTHNIKDVTYCRFKTLSFVRDVVKVRVNHIGQIISIGEY
jgi:CRISPR-associated endonuclease Csn1